MKYTVGLQFTNDEFLECIIQNKEHIGEVYFAWGDFPNGRSNQLQNDRYTPWELQQRQIEMLKKLSEHQIGLNLLFNANCYGKDSQSRAFFNKVGMTVDYIQSSFGLQSITTTSPLIAKFIKNNFENITVRASVNMEIGTIQGMDYLAQYFDGYYMKREWNRDFEKIRELSAWCRENGKKLHMLANSGCLNHCSAHNFHDNLVAHEQEISLATRVHRAPSMVLNSYIREKYSGNILELLEPAHSIYPYVIENGEPLRLVKINEEAGGNDSAYK